MMILGIFLNRYVRTGAHKRYLRLLASLAQRGYAVLVACPKGSEVETFPSIQVLSVPKLDTRFRVFALFRHLNRMSLDTKTSRLLVFGFNNAIMGLLLKFALGLPLIVAIRGYLVDARSINLPNKSWKTRLARIKLLFVALMENILYRFSDAVTLQSEHHRSTVVKRYRLGRSIQKKIHVIPNDIPSEPLGRRTRNPAKEDDFFLLFVGNQTKRKGLKVFFEALGLLAGEGLNRHLRIRIAGIEERDWQGPLPPQDASISVEFLGWRNDIPELMKESDLLVIPSLNEPFPNVVLEALAVGLPAIGSAVGGIQEIIDDDRLLFPPGDTMAIKEKIRRIVTESTFYTLIKERCHERKAIYLFDWVARFESLINVDPLRS